MSACALGSFCGQPLDRSTGAQHKDPEWEATALSRPETRFLLFSSRKGSTGAAPLLAEQRPQPLCIAWQGRPQLEKLGVKAMGHACNGMPPVFLGARAGVQHFALLVDIAEEDICKSCEAPPGRTLVVAEGMGKLLFIGCDAGDFTTLGQAFAKITWHKKNQFDGATGAVTEPIECGLKRKCPSTRGRAYPRSDPVAIALVRDALDKACLLVSVREIPGMWTCPSGFVEAGEQAEEAIRREVLEETRVCVDLEKGVTWLGTQPWPLGKGGSCELMLGAEVEAAAAAGEVSPNLDEVGDARWFTREEVAAMMKTPFGGRGPFLPGENAIAYHLVRRWLDGTTARSGRRARASLLPQVLVGLGCGVAAFAALRLCEGHGQKLVDALTAGLGKGTS